jgi:hypothetical protein
MAITRFYTGQSDPNLRKDDLIKSGDIYVQVLEYSGTATLDLTTPAAATFSFTAPSNAVADAYNSVGNNLEIYTDDAVVAITKITDTAVTSDTCVITFDATAAVYRSDGSTDIESDLTDTEDYSIRVWTPTKSTDGMSGAYGKYLGWQQSLSTNIEDTYAMLKIDIPRQLKDKALVERVITATGASNMVASIDTLKLIYNSVAYGSQTGKTSIATGFNAPAQSVVRLYIVNEDRAQRTIVDEYLYGTFSSNGETDRLSTEFKTISWMFEAQADGFYPENANGFLTVRND